ncbi:MAG: hypothetical protein U0270_08885 [Labilithrix sp.]
MSSAEDEARLKYQQLVNEYGAALVSKDAARAKDLLVRSTVAWEQLRTYPGPESELDGDVHLVTALQFAIHAEDAQEAKRLYDSMSPKFQSIISGDSTNTRLMAWLASGA